MIYDMNMTPKQLDQLLTKNGLSQSEAARQIGVDARTMRRYIAGDTEIPLTVEIALNAIAESWGSTVELRAVNLRLRAIAKFAEGELKRIASDGQDCRRVALSALKKIVEMYARSYEEAKR